MAKNETLEMVKEVVRIKQVLIEGEIKRVKIVSPHDAAEIATKFIGDEDREVFLVMVLDAKNQVNAVHRCHVGSLNSSIVHPREVMKSVILNNGASFIVSHQHPSGSPEPSQEDIAVSQRLKEVGSLLGIELLDSLIVTNNPNTYISLKELDYL